MKLANSLRYPELPDKDRWARQVRKAVHTAGSADALAEVLNCRVRSIYRWQTGRYYPTRVYFLAVNYYLNERMSVEN